MIHLIRWSLLSQDLYFKAEIERLRRELTELSDMSDSENIYSIPLDPENQSREKSSGKTKASDETEDEDIPRLEFLQEEYSQELNFQLSHSFILFKLKCTSLFWSLIHSIREPIGLKFN